MYLVFPVIVIVLSTALLLVAKTNQIQVRDSHNIISKGFNTTKLK
jgi:hypothetical protein